jgi:virginiamycin B lyase
MKLRLALAVLSTIGVSAAQPMIDVRTYQLSSTRNPSVIAWRFTQGPDGAIWFTIGCPYIPCPNAYDGIGRIAPNGFITQYPLPPSSLPRGNAPFGITTGPDGALWFTELAANKIGRLTVGGLLTEYPLSTPDGPYDITTGSDGALWFTVTNGSMIGRITTTGVVTNFRLDRGVDPSHIISGPDGALWFTNLNSGRMGRIGIGGDITMFPVPDGCPLGLTTGRDGAVWFTCFRSNMIGRITTGGTQTTYALPTANSEPSGITVGPDGAIWFGEQTSGYLGRLTLGGIFTEYPLAPGSTEVASGLSSLWTNRPVGYISQITVRVDDISPPVIVPHITGTAGYNGWYRGIASVTWAVSDPESGIGSSSGCGTTTLTADTAGTTLTCSATNSAGLSNSVSVTIKIDSTPPAISGMPTAGCALWPPNNKLIHVADVKASDALAGLGPGSFRVNGGSNEPSPAGNPDIVVAPDGSGGFVIQLRADRLAGGRGRVYMVTATAMDKAGNSTTATSTCIVPHDRAD